MKIYFEEASVNKPNVIGQGDWTLENLSGITVIFGKNGSGKSKLLRNWRDTNPDQIHYVVPERGGNINFQARYLQQQSDAQQRKKKSSSNWLNDYRQQVIGRIQAYFLTRGAVKKEQLPGDPAEIEFFLNQLLPDFIIELEGSNPPYKLVRSSNENKVGNIDQLSSGEAQLITLGLDICTIASIWDIQNQGKRLLLIDEPDAHIHPDLQSRFADFLVQVANKYKLQVVIATHSTTLLSAVGQFGEDETSVIYLDRRKSEFTAHHFSNILQDISACLGGHILMGPLFGSPLLLVEGHDDYRIWSQVPRHHVINLAVIPCKGEEIKKHQKNVEKVLGSLRDNSVPAGYALLDGDKGLPDTRTVPQNQICKA